MTRPRIAVSAPVGAGPLLVLGASLGTSGLLWRDTIPALAEAFRVVTWDLPGHGASPPASESFTVGDLADAVVAEVAEHDERPFAYAGVSIGGATGLELALRHPGRIRALAVIASGARLSQPDAWATRAELVRTASTSAVLTSSAERWFAPGSPARHPELTGALLHALQETDDESYALCCEALAGYDVRARLGQVACPTVVMWGEADIAAPEAKAREVADGVPGARLVRIDDAAHLPPAEQPGAVADVLRDFFDADEERGR